MRKVTAVAVVIGLIAFSSGVFAEEIQKPAATKLKNGITNYHQTGPIDPKDAGKYGMDSSIKKKKLDNYPSATIGEAFGKYSYFKTGDWKVTQLQNHKTYVDFTGMFKKGFFDFMMLDKNVSQQGVEIKFVVYEDGRLAVAMISKVQIVTNGMVRRYPIEDIKTILDKIYANKEIKF